MEKETRSAIELATQKTRRLLEADFQEQLDGVFDVRIDGRVAEEPGAHLDAGQRRMRRKIVAAIEHKRAGGMKPADAVVDYLRDAAFTVLNRFVALKMLEARELVQPCVSDGEASSGFNEFCGLAPGVRTPDGAGYRLYLECLFDELSTEVKVLFDRRDAPSTLWPRRAAFLELLDILNAPALSEVWGEDETIGWVYQYFNGQDERRAMREASQAPRNSRELAVRNQFFTPRYVVQFLTDNTLGRIWYEMRGGETVLAHQCKYMVRQPDEQWVARAKKDPRDLRVLDPACGSGHFLLYAFDLLITIYQEAWADTASPASESTAAALRADYPDLADLKLAMPGLILSHNLHGVDIDPRCAQIAQLALWMRAQRAFRELGVDRAHRPLIRRSNIVIAEPMPGEQDLRDEFLRELKEDRLEGLMRRALDIPADRHVHANKAMADSLTTLVEMVWDEMAFAGDLGVLLKIERTLARAIETARREWEADMPLFRISEYGLADGGPQAGGDEIDGPTLVDAVDFWAKAERLVLRALEEYAEATRGASFDRRRLFADDAAHGFALVDVASKTFDAILMNPPFGDGTPRSREKLTRNFPDARLDLYACFVEFSLGRLSDKGRIGIISSRLGMFLGSLESWRDNCLLGGDGYLSILADLGHNVLDGALVEAAAYVIAAEQESRPPWAASALELLDKAGGLKSFLDHPDHIRPGLLAASQRIPGRPIPYWLPQSIVEHLTAKETLGNTHGRAAVGLQTDDDFRFLRLAWEVPSERVGLGKFWAPFCKGGEYSPYYDDIHLIVRWSESARELKAFIERKYTWTKNARSASRYGEAGLTYPERTTSEFSPRPMPAGSIFSIAGPAILPSHPEFTYAMLAVLYTRWARVLIEAYVGGGDAVHAGSAARHYKTGLINALPMPSGNGSLWREMSELGETCAVSRASEFTLDETARLFGGFPRLAGSASDYLEDYLRFIEDCLVTRERASVAIERAVNNLYGLGDAELAYLNDVYGRHPGEYAGTDSLQDVSAMLHLEYSDLRGIWSEKSGNSRQITKLSHWTEPHYEAVAQIAEIPVSAVVAARQSSGQIPARVGEELAIRLVSYWFGMAFGRWRVPVSEQFQPMEGNQLSEFLPKSPAESRGVRVPSLEIQVDDEGHVHDIVEGLMRGANETGFDQDRLSEIAKDVVARHNDLRGFLRRKFFDAHLGIYSKSRRKAPIYWQLATPSASYSVWLYIHAFGKDTLFRVQSDYVAPKLAHERRELEGLLAEAGHTPTTVQSRAIEAQSAFVEDLSTLLDEVKRVAPLWDPDLDDGVILNFAPLWRLVPQNRAWQKELRAAWASLVDGDYDWAHLSMRLWPERVVPKCAKDRSLAIAHDLEDVFWFEDAASKWQARPTPTRSLDDLIAERTSLAVKAALQSLLDAPDPVAASGRGRRKKS